MQISCSGVHKCCKAFDKSPWHLGISRTFFIFLGGVRKMCCNLYELQVEVAAAGVAATWQPDSCHLIRDRSQIYGPATLARSSWGWLIWNAILSFTNSKRIRTLCTYSNGVDCAEESLKLYGSRRLMDFWLICSTSAQRLWLERFSYWIYNGR